MDKATNEQPQQDWYWCDTCCEFFYGNASIIHRGSKCYAKESTSKKVD